MKRDKYQCVVVEFNDGQAATFTGKAVAFKGDTRKIRSVKFTIPKPLPTGHSFEPLLKKGNL